MLDRMFTTATFTDDIYSRDPTTVALESKVAELSGHESAMLVASGTMGNQLCLRTHLTQPPHSVLCDERAHIFTNEAGGLAMFSQAQINIIRPKNGIYVTLEEVIENIIPEDDHYAPTKVISLENTLSGVVLPYSEARRISEYIRSEYKGEIKLHLDGSPLPYSANERGTFVECYCGRENQLERVLFSIRLCFVVLFKGHVDSYRICYHWIYIVHEEGTTFQESFWRWFTESWYFECSMFNLP
jgi:threonine aldolase